MLFIGVVVGLVMVVCVASLRPGAAGDVTYDVLWWLII
jgi:hypothetical protein